MSKNAKIILGIGGVVIVAAVLFKFLIADKDPGQRSQARGVPGGAVVMQMVN